MNLVNQEKDQKQELSVSPESTKEAIQVCSECGQTYIFQDVCSICEQKRRESSEAIVLAATVKNFMDNVGIVDLYNIGSGNLRKIHDILFKNITIKGDPNVDHS